MKVKPRSWEGCQPPQTASLRGKARHIGTIQKARIPMDGAITIMAHNNASESVVEQPLGDSSQISSANQLPIELASLPDTSSENV